MRLLLIAVITFSLSIQALAQVAVPSLDPSISSDLPSVTSFRYHNTGALSYGTGTLESDDGDGDFKESGGMLALNMDGLGLEAYMNSFKFDGEFGDSAGTIDFTRESRSSQIGISYLLNGFLSIGVGQYSNNLVDEGSGSSSFKDEHDISALKLSANLLLSEIFFLGAGINNFTKTGTSGDSSGTYDRQELEWQETVLGAALLIGDPGDFQLKAELSMKSSPEVGETTSGQVIKNGKRKSDATTGIIEIKSGDYFVSYTAQTIQEAEIDEKYTKDERSEKTSELSTLGIGYVNKEGFMLTLYATTRNETEKDTGGDRETDWKQTTISVGYNF